MDKLKAIYGRFLRFEKPSDHFKHLIRLHQLIGFNLVDPFAINIWKLSVALMIGHALCFVYRLYKVTVIGLGLSYIVCAFMVVGGYVSGAMRIAGFIYYYEDFTSFWKYLLQCSKFQQKDHEAQHIRKEHYENNQKFTLGMLSAGCGAIIIWNLTDYRVSDYYKIPFELSYLDPNVKSVVETIYGFYLLALALYFWIPFITIRVALRTLRAELLILNKAFQRVFHTTAKNCEVVHPSLALVSQQKDRFRSDLFWKCLHDELQRLVVHHKELLENVDRIRRLACVPFLAEMFAAISISSIAIFLFMLLKRESLVMVSVSVILLVECYYNSSMVEELEDAHFNTGQVLYGIDWPMLVQYDRQHIQEYKHVRKILLIAMMRSQQRLRFHCGGLFEMSMETFAVTVKTCYTILTFLMQIQGV